MKNFSKKTKILLVALNILVVLVFPMAYISKNNISFPTAKSGIGGALDDQLADLNKQLKDIRDQKDVLQGQLDTNNYTISGYNDQVSKLYAEAEVFNKDLQEVEIQIKQLEVQISILDNQIVEQKKDIADTETTIAGLEKESDARIVNSYYNYRLYRTDDDPTSVLNLGNINAYFKTSQYKEIVQSGTNDLMVKLAELKQQLQDKKKELDDKKIQQEKDKEVIDVKKVDLSKKKEEADIKVANYMATISQLQSQNSSTQYKIYAVSADEQQKQAQANLIQQQIMNSYVPPSQGQYVAQGTYIGQKGCTGLCTGAHLHFMVYDGGVLQNPCNYIPGGYVDGCGGSGRVGIPLHGGITLTSGFGNRCFWWGNSNYCDFHTGIDLVSDPWNAPVFAATNGYVHQGTDEYGANYVILCENPDCSGIKTGYWHLSSF